MSIEERTQEKNTWYQYQVVATVEYETNERSVTDTALYDFESAWISDREMAVNLAKGLREAGHGVEIRTRKRGSFAPKDFDAIPERGDAK